MVSFAEIDNVSIVDGGVIDTQSEDDMNLIGARGFL